MPFGPRLLARTLQPVHPKGQGKGIMVSDFITEYTGYLRLNDVEFREANRKSLPCKKEERVLWRYGVANQGYWGNEYFIDQVKVAAKIVEVKFLSLTHDLVFIFDQSSGHTAFPEDAPNVHRMNVKPGGQQPPMHNTLWSEKV